MASTDTLYIRVGIASLDQMRDRTLSIARGEWARDEDEPKVWFTSIDALARIFSERSMLLLEMIRNSEPLSVKDLAARTAREEAELVHELHVFERVGLLDIKEDEEGFIQEFKRTPFNKIRAEAEVGKSRICWEAEIGVAA